MTNKQVGSHGVLKVRETRGWISHHATKLQAKERAMERQWGGDRGRWSEVEDDGRRPCARMERSGARASEERGEAGALARLL
jgi:hypothetical protein